MATGTTERGWRKWGPRLGWLVLLWVVSVAALGTLALLLRGFMAAAGFSR